MLQSFVGTTVRQFEFGTKFSEQDDHIIYPNAI